VAKLFWVSDHLDNHWLKNDRKVTLHELIKIWRMAGGEYRSAGQNENLGFAGGRAVFDSGWTCGMIGPKSF